MTMNRRSLLPVLSVALLASAIGAAPAAWAQGKPIRLIVPYAPGGSSALYTWVGLQTDYSSVGRGVITPRMIEAVLRQAKAL